MRHKKHPSHLKHLLIALAVVIVAGGLYFFTQKNERGKNPGQPAVISEQQNLPSDSKPIVKEHNGISEVSLPEAVPIINKPTIEQLKNFRKRAADLAEEAKQVREKKIVRFRGTDIEVLPLYTFEEQKKGLIGVEFLPKDSGTLYVFQMDDPGRGFGTKGMKFPLDFIWMNSDLTVVHMTKNVPPEYSENIMSVWPARYVVEVNAGYIDAHGISVGDTAQFEHIPH